MIEGEIILKAFGIDLNLFLECARTGGTLTLQITPVQLFDGVGTLIDEALRVKPLEWVELIPGKRYRSKQTMLGRYDVGFDTASGTFESRDEAWRFFSIDIETVDDAKAVAQQDYERQVYQNFVHGGV